MEARWRRDGEKWSEMAMAAGTVACLRSTNNKKRRGALQLDQRKKRRGALELKQLEQDIPVGDHPKKKAPWRA